MDFLIKFKSFIKGEGAMDLRQLMKEKRFFPRIRCAVETKCTDHLGEEFSAIAVEASIYGMRIYTDRKMRPEQKIFVEAVPGKGIFSGAVTAGSGLRMKVIWCKKKPTTHDYLAGLHYEDSKKNLQASWVADLLSLYGISVGLSPQKRRKIRIPADLPLGISIALRTFTGTIIDMGAGGMLISSDMNIHMKETLTFRIGPLGNLEQFTAEGRIIHERYVQSTRKWIYGVLFLEMNEKQQHILGNYLTALCTEQRE
ncbi:MAG: PilZ domain-containing protein [Candidatus Eremiobacteraeota bacterium]|nr:PilZ domain-containing protein [Candidatus Eremiobacteraeota bacterium]